MLSEPQQRAALSLVHAAIATRLSGESPPRLPSGGELDEPRGVFVTLLLEGKLRGCIGFTTPELPLAEAIAGLALRAAFHDRRFSPVTQAEASRLQVELSVLSPLQPADPAAIEIGRHGLHLSCRGKVGLLLPQVASSRGWDAQTFLQQTCAKAGLSTDAWQQPGAVLSWFTCDIYEEPAGG